MSSERIERHVLRRNTPDIRRMDGRYVRWSWRYEAFQLRDPITGNWRNISADSARTWAAAGLPVGCHGGASC